MELMAIVLIAAAVPGFFLVLGGLWSIWLALGRTPIAIRVPIFLLGTLPLGLLVCLLGGRQSQVIPYAGMLVLAVLCAAVLERRYVIVSGLCTLFALGYGLHCLRGGIANGEWLTNTTVALSLLAGLISMLRAFGFRLICFTTDAISREIEQASGRDIDEWIVRLDEEGASAWNFAEIVIFLRSFGFDYRWQKAIAIAYEKSLGRRSVDRTFEGKPQQIRRSIGWTLPDWFSQFGQQRFSIVQVLLWSVAAATFFAFMRLIGRFEISIEGIVVGTSLILGMACISIAALQRFLGVRDRRPQVVLILLLATPCLAVPLTVGLFPGVAEIYALVAAGMLGYAIWLIFALLLIRQRGYRLVRVQTARNLALSS